MLRTICAGVEEVLVQGIIGEWLRRKCGVEGGAVFCAECYKYMLLRKYDGRGNTWARKQSVRWFRHCGPCDDAYSIWQDLTIT